MTGQVLRVDELNGLHHALKRTHARLAEGQAQVWIIRVKGQARLEG
mgnify:CR=1 FL=1